MEKINTDKKSLVKFSITMLAGLAVIGTLLLLKHNSACVWFYFTGALFFLAGVFAGNLLKPVYIAWMKIAFILSWINTRIILFAIFYLVFTPIGIFMRLIGADLLGLKIHKDKESYWIKKDGKVNYERQF